VSWLSRKWKYGLNSASIYRKCFWQNSAWETNFIKNAGFVVLTAVVKKGTMLWNIMPCSPLKVKRTSVEYIASRALSVICFYTDFLLGLVFNPANGGDMFLWNFGWLWTDYIALYPIRRNTSAVSFFTWQLHIIVTMREVDIFLSITIWPIVKVVGGQYGSHI
jgi:hypothetical protein